MSPEEVSTLPLQWETTESIHSQVEINLFMHFLLQSEKRGKIIVSDLFFLHNFWLCCFFLRDGVESSGLPTATSPANENRAAVMNTPDEDTACHLYAGRRLPEIFISAAQEAHDAYKSYHYDNDRDDPAMRVP